MLVCSNRFSVVLILMKMFIEQGFQLLFRCIILFSICVFTTRALLIEINLGASRELGNKSNKGNRIFDEVANTIK